MSRIICVANWSEGRRQVVLDDMRSALRQHEVNVHYDGADYDHNRMVTALSGAPSEVDTAMFAAAEIAFAKIDMRSHEGVHPRIGALDVCPFIVRGDSMPLDDALAFANGVGEKLANRYALPVFLYEKSESGKHARDLPSLRKGQYEGLLGRKLDADFGPAEANPQLGATVLGVRDWLLAMNVNLAEKEAATALRIARQIRLERTGGDQRFIGVRALGLKLASRGLSQVSMNLTQPDNTPADPIIEWIGGQAEISGTELIGVIRPQDAEKATRLPIAPEQIVDP